MRVISILFKDLKDLNKYNIIQDQTIKADAGKPSLSLVPRKIIWAIAKIREYGVAKYGSSEN